MLVQSYIDGVLSGDIVACRLVQAAVSRHTEDIKRQSTPDFPYHFSWDAAEAAIDFFPMCLKHSIGEHSGLPFVLEPWQAFGVAMIFGWKRDDDNTRRFRRVLWEMARKNGKSTLASGIAIQLAGCDVNPIAGELESVANVFLCATKMEQSQNVIFAEVLRMRDQSPAIRDSSSVKYSAVKFTQNHGTIKSIGSDRPFSGLNPHGIIVDEFHEFQENRHGQFIDTMLTAAGARAQPLYIVTTTAGTDRSYMWIDFRKYVESVVKGDFTDDQVFGFIFQIDEDDDPLDETVWIKANPNLGVSIKPDFLKQMATEATQSVTARNRFVQYHCNRLVSSKEQAFDLTAWDNCKGNLSDWKAADAIGGGIDLGGRDDLAAWALVARFPMGHEHGRTVWRYEIKTQAYIAGNTQRDLSKQPFAEWIHTQQIRTAAHPISELKSDFVEAARTYGVRDVAYDPYNGQQFAEDIEREGITIARFAQNCSMFNEPISDFMQAITDGRVTHDGSPLLRWCIGNAVLTRDHQERWMFSKRDSADKIDPVVAVVMAYRRAMVAEARAQGSLFVS